MTATLATACPAWCRTCTPLDSDRPDGPKMHQRPVSSAAGVEVRIVACDPEDDGARERPHVMLDDRGGADSLTAEQALSLGVALRQASLLLREIEGSAQPSRTSKVRIPRTHHS